jgi:hypothetical protein
MQQFVMFWEVGGTACLNPGLLLFGDRPENRPKKIAGPSLGHSALRAVFQIGWFIEIGGHENGFKYLGLFLV